MKTILHILFVCSLASLPVCSAEFDVLPGDLDGVAPGCMMEAWLTDRIDEAFEAREARLAAIADNDEFIAYRDGMREFLFEQLGGFPERTPLNPEIVERIDGDGYRIEKIIFESQPRHYVTALLFLPDTEPPYPGVLVPCGHSANGKAYDGYQRACILLARHGMAALIYDPIDQGERYQILDSELKPRIGGTAGHTMTGVGSILLGRNTVTYRIWDGVRALDYLTSRPEIDTERIGCTGNSGGGTMTSFLMAVDERIKVAAPSCYLSTLQMVPPQDAEQNVHAQFSVGMDHADFIHMRAPWPTLICAATRDFFPIEGTWKTFREAKRFYTRLGYPHRVEIAEANEEHGFTRPLRQAAVQWMKRWLVGVDQYIVEPEDLEPLSEEKAQCAPNGQVMSMADARSVYDLNRELEDTLADQRETLWENATPESARKSVREISKVREANALPRPRVEQIEFSETEGASLTKLIIRPEEGITLPAVLIEPKGAEGAPVLYLHDQGNAMLAEDPGLRNRITLAVDLRGIGETRHDEDVRGDLKAFGANWRNIFRAYMLGKPYLAMRCEDILVSARWLAERAGEPVELRAFGELGPPALHAAFLEPQLFEKTMLARSLQSWTDVIAVDLNRNQLINTVHGALKVYDLVDLAAALPEDALHLIEPVDATGASIQ